MDKYLECYQFEYFSQDMPDDISEEERKEYDTLIPNFGSKEELEKRKEKQKEEKKQLINKRIEELKKEKNRQAEFENYFIKKEPDVITLFDIFELDSYSKIKDFIIKNPSDLRSNSIIEFMFECDIIENPFEHYDWTSNIDEEEFIKYNLKNILNPVDFSKFHTNKTENFIFTKQKNNKNKDKNKAYLLFEMFELFSYRDIKNYVYHFPLKRRSMDILKLLREFGINPIDFYEKCEIRYNFFNNFIIES